MKFIAVRARSYSYKQRQLVFAALGYFYRLCGLCLIDESILAALNLHLMIVGVRLRALREAKGLTQGDIQKLTGLLRPHISRTENGHTTPSVETLEKWARALGVPLYSIFYEGDAPPSPAPSPKPNQPKLRRKDEHFIQTLCLSLSKMYEPNRQLLLQTARRMASRTPRK